MPETVIVKKNKNIIKFTGPLGSSKINIEKVDRMGVTAIKINHEGKLISIISSEKSSYNAIIGLIKNKIYGVSQGFLLYLRIVGIGYRCFLTNQTLTLKVGYSHDVKFRIPESIRIFLLEPTLICLFGIDKNQVTQLAAQIRQIKPPSPYKGKGIRLLNETVFIKQGKQK